MNVICKPDHPEGMGLLKMFYSISFIEIKNFSGNKCGPLSLICCLGRPCIANISRKTFVVLAAVVDDMSTISGYLEKASTAIKKVLPIKGPAKSKYSLTYGLASHIHRCNGTAIGAF